MKDYNIRLPFLGSWPSHFCIDAPSYALHVKEADGESYFISTDKQQLSMGVGSDGQNHGSIQAPSPLIYGSAFELRQKLGLALLTGIKGRTLTHDCLKNPSMKMHVSRSTLNDEECYLLSFE